MAGINTNRTTAGIELPKTVAAEIWAETAQNSVVQQLVPRFELPAGGTTIQMITGDPEADWVKETDEKPVSESTFGAKVLQPYKLAVIELFSDEFRRDLPALYSALAQRLPYALGRKFDKTVLGFDEAPGENFDTLADAPELAVDGTPKGYIAALRSVGSNRGNVTGWAASPEFALDALETVDQMGRPMFVQDYSTNRNVGSILGAPVYQYRQVANENVLGFAGDWTSAAWGAVTGIQVAISDQATITKGGQPINLWQRNMFAIRAEVEVGFRVRDVKRFVKLTKAESEDPSAGVGVA